MRYSFDRAVETLEPTDEALDAFGYGYGSDFRFITDAQMQALRDGKVLAFSDGEYSHFLKLE